MSLNSSWGDAWGNSWGTSWGITPSSGIIPATLATRELRDNTYIVGIIAVGGSFHILEPTDTVSASSHVVALGNMSVFEANDTVSISGTRVALGTIYKYESPDITTMSGGLTVTGEIGISEPIDHTYMVGDVLISWVFAITEQPDIFRGSNLPLQTNEASMALYVLPKYTVVKIADSQGAFRVENRSTDFVNIKYSSTTPSISDDDWGTITDQRLEVSLGLGLSLYAYSDFGGELVVYRDAYSESGV